MSEGELFIIIIIIGNNEHWWIMHDKTSDVKRVILVIHVDQKAVCYIIQ